MMRQRPIPTLTVTLFPYTTLFRSQRQGPVSGPKKQGSDMSKRENSKHKIDRRLGLNLWGRSKSPINKREYGPGQHGKRSEEHTCELQSLMRISYAVFCLKKKRTYSVKLTPITYKLCYGLS